ncbi:MAG: ThuA domain-containing protein [Phycisphaerales bacterium]|nr:ThuA domain-containing protein [Phycisphaerales bacterium]
MGKSALIVWGGWDGHQPRQVADIFQRTLVEEGFAVEVSDTLDAFLDAEKLNSLNLIVPIWTMGKITEEQFQPVNKAVQSGVGLAGCHGGMCDAFRESPEWQFMTGGQWVAHPGNDGVRYQVRITDHSHPITRGIDDFEVSSEQYYMHVDPAVKVLAVTPMPVVDGPHVPNGPVRMPVVWTKFWGKGRVFYNSLGHQENVVQSEPCLTLMRRGFQWAAKA